MHVWRSRLHLWLSPLARRCPLSPNAITIIALLLNATAAWLLYERRFLIALGFITVGGLADAFDGIVARVQEKSSRYGDFLDHVCDRVSDLLMVIGWLLGNNVRDELAMAVVLAVMLNGYIGTQIEATWRERNYDSVGRGEFVLGMILYPIVSDILFDNGWAALTPGGLLIAEWMCILLLAFALLGIVQRFALASRLDRTR
ncbi:MAG TPA: CDP-alcohol phosphatidyltransferase family protein [Thermoanaerobaculia bacterium]|jgi:phosphatidylglycerophosphate synthase|nr:CDP-alcohol phosphatidyltransferase family protein [Thermoanaerobaculia bacterium]